MLKRGAVKEVKKFLNLKISENRSISKAIGIAEIEDFINKKIVNINSQILKKKSLKEILFL